jgi:hypothetical protein
MFVSARGLTRFWTFGSLVITAGGDLHHTLRTSIAFTMKATTTFWQRYSIWTNVGLSSGHPFPARRRDGLAVADCCYPAGTPETARTARSLHRARHRLRGRQNSLRRREQGTRARRHRHLSQLFLTVGIELQSSYIGDIGVQAHWPRPIGLRYIPKCGNQKTAMPKEQK